MPVKSTNSDNTIKTVTNKKSSRFILSRKNQKGQVAIFVALIFQVVFVFFALLINVGLLVHQKINLQQSTDLAAYYGAMKQAEMMNTIAHVNFQVKQAWKLLTWRYRILGTFGFTKSDDSAPSQDYPFEYLGKPSLIFKYNGGNGNKCTLPDSAEPLGVQDIPFFCVGHGGFANWPQGESNCQLNCEGFGKARVIEKIPQASNITTPFGGNVSGSVNQAVDAINVQLATRCKSLGPTGAVMLSRFLASYINDTFPRLRTIEVLARNLSAESNKVLDIEGNSVQDASLLTLKNNLTEANKTGFADAEFATFNGLSNDKCRFSDGQTGTQFLRKIDFKVINYFIHNCINTTGDNLYRPESVYDASTGTGLGPAFNVTEIPPSIRDIILSLVTDPNSRHTIGYEKNPNCIEYYAVKATSEPQIPFLPITRIKLSATAIAKPFGGTIGPWYGKTWPQASDKSVFDDSNPQTKVDETLPMRDLTGDPNAAKVTKSIFSQPNFSLFVGDKIGLRNSDYIAAYHSAIAIRDIKRFDSSLSNNPNPGTELLNPPPGTWPHINNWANIDNASLPDFRDYDSLSSLDADKDGMRSLEIAAIAPNQFDITHYSIEPDFYNNYYVKLASGGIKKIIEAVGSNMKEDWLRADFGAVGMRADNSSVEEPLTTRTYSVKDQILLKNRIFDVTPGTPGPGNPGKSYRDIMNNQVMLQSSLLTGWTFKNYSNYEEFAGGSGYIIDPVSRNMAFGQCANDWNKSNSPPSPIDSQNFKTPPHTDPNKFPPTPGNCITGGRTGYSVKIVSPKMVRDKSLLINELPSGFLDF